ncbi:Phytanoyl-CoA dioxygenase (PhyH) [Pirellula sp. SH-Sr6A]|uniref:phytanoyl-CoA dioxygenase family protein n=1 Tax=Pirellula sp. SH-Sr6A TaxID=1632865 RepID=UPI00078D791A|nr:phytanoyl-CoA dioxygenase family protein [Pirellula sp. SH-Sr6A]AMV33202.1 Phytanoyl-CoA dioxygenase (PhyH) [Pirellula sp. SH-Sr6A]
MTTNETLHHDSHRILNEAAIRQYHEEGYLTLKQFFAPEKIEELGKDVDRVLVENRAILDPRNMRVRFKPHHATGANLLEVLDPIADLSPVAKSLTMDDRLLSVLFDLYGEPAELFKDKLIYKPPGALGASLHQDWIAWPGFPTTFLTVLVAIDPFTEKSGATEVYPRGHLNGTLSPMDGKHHVLSEEQMECEPVSLVLDPGDIAIFGCMVPHRSSANTSDTSRRGYFISYNARSDGGQQYPKHYQEFHSWIRSRIPTGHEDRLYFQ